HRANQRRCGGNRFVCVALSFLFNFEFGSRPVAASVQTRAYPVTVHAVDLGKGTLGKGKPNCIRECKIRGVVFQARHGCPRSAIPKFPVNFCSSRFICGRLLANHTKCQLYSYLATWLIEV